MSGAWANTAGDQAAQLVEGIKQQVDWETKWKLITVQFGGNDICTTYCESDPSSEDYGDATPAGWRVNMDSVLNKLSSMTRTLVVFTESYMPSKLRNMVGGGFVVMILQQVSAFNTDLQEFVQRTEMVNNIIFITLSGN